MQNCFMLKQVVHVEPTGFTALKEDEVLKMSSMRFNADLKTSQYGPPHPLSDIGPVTESLIFETSTSGQRRILMVLSTLDTRSNSSSICGQGCR
jgi:hypothetical protein